MVKPVEASEMPVPTEVMALQNNHFTKYFINITNGKIGTFEGTVKFAMLPHSGHAMKGVAVSAERYMLDIPYAGQHLQWHVMFDAQEPDSPPQFLFPETPDFLQDMNLDELEAKLPSLANWDCDDADSLLKVVRELVIEYRSLQKQLLKDTTFPGLQFKVFQLFEAIPLSESDYELTTDNNSVTILVRLAIDLSKVPELLLPPIEKGHQEVLASLLLKVQDSRQNSQLLLSPRMQIIIGVDCKVPTLQSREAKELNLPEYVSLVKKQLNNKILMVVGGIDARKNFLAALVTLMGRALVEHDTKEFSKASFLLEWNNFFFLVHCCLPNEFPHSQPIYLFQSVYHTSKQRPYTSKCSNYPYKATWGPAEMADKAKNFISEYVAKFQADSIRA